MKLSQFIQRQKQLFKVAIGHVDHAAQQMKDCRFKSHAWHGRDTELGKDGMGQDCPPSCASGWPSHVLIQQSLIDLKTGLSRKSFKLSWNPL